MTVYPGMSPDEKDLFDRLHEYVFQLRYDWATFLALYGVQSAVATLNKVAPEFFGGEQGRLRDAIFLAVARLFDPAYSMGNATKTNLTLPELADILRSSQPDLADKIENAFGKAAVDADPVKNAIKNERHKRIAHLDRPTAFGNNILPDVTRDELDAVISEIESVMNHVDDTLRGITTDYEAIIMQANQHANKLLLPMSIVAGMIPSEMAEAQLKLGDTSTVDPNV